MAGKIILREKGNAIAALTRAVIGRAIINGDMYGKIKINNPVPMINGDAASVRKLTISIDCDVMENFCEIRTISPDIESAIPIEMKEETIATVVELNAAIHTVLGKLKMGIMPLMIIENNGKNRNKHTKVSIKISNNR